MLTSNIAQARTWSHRTSTALMLNTMPDGQEQKQKNKNIECLQGKGRFTAGKKAWGIPSTWGSSKEATLHQAEAQINSRNENFDLLCCWNELPRRLPYFLVQYSQFQLLGKRSQLNNCWRIHFSLIDLIWSHILGRDYCCPRARRTYSHLRDYASWAGMDSISDAFIWNTKRYFVICIL